MVRAVFAVAALFSVFWGCTGSALKAVSTSEGESAKEEFNLYYQADIRHNGRHVCSGAVLGEYDVLTSARCIYSIKHEELTVIVGKDICLSENITDGVHEVVAVQIHPLYDDETGKYDLAIIKVQKPFKFGRYVDSVVIPPSGDELRAGESAVVCGRTSQSIEGRGHYKEAQVTILPREECNQRIDGYHGVSDVMICSELAPISNVQNGVYTDPGAPLVAHGKLYGIASVGMRGTPDYFAYTDVSKMDDFLRDNTFISGNAKSKICAALQLVISLLPSIPGIPFWVVTALNFLLGLLGC